jgi:hypothetical protein
VLVITGEGLKTLDAVRGTFETHTIAPSVEAFEAGVQRNVWAPSPTPALAGVGALG